MRIFGGALCLIVDEPVLVVGPAFQHVVHGDPVGLHTGACTGEGDPAASGPGVGRWWRQALLAPGARRRAPGLRWGHFGNVLRLLGDFFGIVRVGTGSSALSSGPGCLGSGLRVSLDHHIGCFGRSVGSQHLLRRGYRLVRGTRGVSSNPSANREDRLEGGGWRPRARGRGWPTAAGARVGRGSRPSTMLTNGASGSALGSARIGRLTGCFGGLIRCSRKGG